VSRFHSYLNSAKEILSLYKGEEPLTSFLKKHFAQHKKFGSKDRKQVSHLCYCYFRLGKALTELPVEERILAALFLCSSQPNEILQQLKPVWNENAMLSFSAKQKLIASSFSTADIFPWQHELSDGIDGSAFSLSHLQQPDLFLRVRPGKENIVLQKLTTSGIEFRQVTDSRIALPNASKVDELIKVNEEAVVQDYSSQQVALLFQYLKPHTSNLKLSLWDCCAASGGKSIMAKDMLGDIALTVSDVRESILVNLKKRFAEAGIREYKSFVTDLTRADQQSLKSKYDLIIADVPCSGSGTWARTPEQLYYFETEKIAVFAALQQKIIANAVTHLLPGGYFLYITCSVFKKENEEAVTLLKDKFQLQEIKTELLKGYDKKADTMFAVLLQNPFS
jgi:16S rRNA (cytosine967-C5)-methyltransferase